MWTWTSWSSSPTPSTPTSTAAVSRHRRRRATSRTSSSCGEIRSVNTHTFQLLSIFAINTINLWKTVFIQPRFLSLNFIIELLLLYPLLSSWSVTQMNQFIHPYFYFLLSISGHWTNECVNQIVLQVYYYVPRWPATDLLLFVLTNIDCSVHWRFCFTAAVWSAV